VHDIFVTHIVLKGSSVMPIVGKLVAGGVAQHINQLRINTDYSHPTATSSIFAASKTPWIRPLRSSPAHSEARDGRLG
jgi:hypothetical protein